ncbi:MAG TPA: hypothetical protein VLE93_01235 [Candidatus Saccharimonadales bacterium]|nr:hypothetical protein [Candidatus Saccharimonadales bacterium]
MHLSIAIDPGTVFQGVAYRRNNEMRVNYGSIVLPSAQYADLELFKERIDSEKFGRELIWQLPDCTSVTVFIERPDRRLALNDRRTGGNQQDYRDLKSVISCWKQLFLSYLMEASVIEVDSLKWQKRLLGRDWSGKDSAKRLSLHYARQRVPTLSPNSSDHITDAVCLLIYAEGICRSNSP